MIEWGNWTVKKWEGKDTEAHVEHTREPDGAEGGQGQKKILKNPEESKEQEGQRAAEKEVSGWWIKSG